MQKVVIASKNKTKVSAVKEAFSALFPLEQFEYEELEVKSNVCDPVTNKETYTGALCRVEEASKATQADFWVGIESGVDVREGECAVFSWVVIKGKNDMIGKAKSTTFYLPDKIFRLVHDEKKLEDSEAIEEISPYGEGRGHKHGTVGVLTDNLIDRTKYYVDPIVLALIPFKNPDLY